MLNVNLQILPINALNAILQIVTRKNLMEIRGNAHAMMATMMMVKITYVNNTLNFGLI